MPATGRVETHRMGIDLNKMLQQLRATLGKMEVALDSIQDAIAWTNQTGEIQWCNESFGALVGRRNLEILGQNLIHLLPLRLKGLPLSYDEHPMNQSLKENRMIQTVLEHTAPTGEEQVLDVHCCPITVQGEKQSLVLVIHDITLQKRSEEAMARARDLALESVRLKSEF